MALEVGCNTIETDANGYLANISDWSEKVAEVIAAEEGIELTEKHWDLINYLRDEYLNNSGNQPNNRTINKFLGGKWGYKLSSKELFQLFPGTPSKQAGRITSRRAGVKGDIRVNLKVE
ncbi:MAG: TusE/DsrC/DsvC family sulfur relay protein [Deltaproteobacteria bacterium]|nr:TusE/DsrC/DsvC family sulfur relay protein [Deltaproteobacteria bacterium]